MKTIGVLGGMGPEATAYSYLKMIECCQKEYFTKYDSDYPRIVIYNLPIPDVVETEFSDQKIMENLKFGMEKLEAAGADFSFIACNSMEKYLPELRKKWSLLSIVEATLSEVKNRGIKTVGLLATKTTIEGNSYQKNFSGTGIELVFPQDQSRVTAAIMEILKGDKTNPKEKFEKLARELAAAGAQSVILACTDIPLVLRQENTEVNLLDTAEIIARAAIKKYYEG